MKIILTEDKAQSQILRYMVAQGVGTPIAIKEMRNKISDQSQATFNRAMEQLARSQAIALQAHTAPNPPKWALYIDGRYYVVAVLR